MPRAVSYTIQDPVIGDVKVLTFLRQSNGSGGFDTICNAYYELPDAGGVIVQRGTVSVTLSGAQQTQLGTFITNNVLPVIETAESL